MGQKPDLPADMDPALRLKLTLLAGSYIKASERLLKLDESENLTFSRVVRTENIYAYPWLFIRLSQGSRVRMVVVSGSAPFELRVSKAGRDRYDILHIETGQLLAVGLELEEAMYHCPRQLFYNLYEFCFMGCKFCPLSAAPRWTRDTLEKMIRDLERFGTEHLDGIGLTSGIPAHRSGDKVAFEMARVVRALRAKIGGEIPIGVSPMHPARETLIALKDAGVNEVRINLEVFNSDLARLLVPGKDPKRALRSIADAVDIFGPGKVSSNLILGIGETDADVIAAMIELATLGAIPTLYPYDPVAEWKHELALLTNGRAGRPGAQRLWILAREHKRILEEYKLDPRGLMTMCPRCGASHIMPGMDL